MAFQPLFDRVVVRQNKSVLVTPGGLLKSEQYAQKPPEGVVVSVGPGTIKDGAFQPTTVKPGDKVMFNLAQAVEIPIDGEKLLFMLEANILGIISV